jgi:hypothetical protein
MRGAVTEEKWRKLVDLPEASTRKQRALEGFLDQHHIPFRRHIFERLSKRRYFVRPCDLCCAQAVLDAIRAIEEPSA